tara:strand:- start:59 stop:751 length:693 start_codon:yes stop_codon:yes gene_type:complete
MNDIAAIIPARGGSKGIPKKNLILLDDEPLIDYTIKFAKRLNLKTFVTSDDEEILERATIHNVERILRPKKYATDKSRIIDTLIHVAKTINSPDEIYKSIIVLQPTYLTREIKEINSAIKFFQNKGLETLVHLTKMKEHPAECIKITNQKNKWEYIIPRENLETNRQAFSDNFYFISGNFYISRINSLLENKSFMHSRTEFYISEDRYLVDIDCYQDLEFAKTQIHRFKN